uniref:zinc finger CCCH domain-containing protein 2-like n=1 Tax=Erigeron canadensis TaxID=72917 RepID=UPI001CB960DA|nr:zinc finger CCCH domain-containing protein 2-like [Erigeron canadensis]
MASSCLEQQQHKSFHPSHHLYKKSTLRDIDIPPRKLLNRRASATSPEAYMADTMYQNESPRVMPEETLFKKFLPYNTGVDSDDEEGDPYAADHFRIYEFKVRKCTRSRSHDWTDCPFAHPGEKARRRCPRRYNYLGTVCADFRRGSCSRGDLCEFAHGVFECWLHPSRYRTEACKDGKNCQRKICFFAHTQRQLRVVPPEPVKKYHSESSSHSRCCAHCRCHLDIHHTNSPTSTLNIDLDSLSPPASPPFSPARSAVYSPISRFADRLARTESFGMTQMGQSAANNSSIISHKDCMNEMMSNHAINELMRSMEAMSVVDDQNPRWMDSCYINGSSSTGGYGGDQQNVCTNNSNNEVSSSVINGPDLGWVNDLLT